MMLGEGYAGESIFICRYQSICEPDIIEAFQRMAIR